MQNIYTKVDAKLLLQNLPDKLKNESKQIEIKEAQWAKIRAKITWKLEGGKCTKYFSQKLQKRKNADLAILSVKSRQSGQILKNQQEIVTEVETFYEQLYRKKRQCPRADRNHSLISILNLADLTVPKKHQTTKN